MHNPVISKIRTHLLQLLTEDRSANTIHPPPKKKKEQGRATRKRVTGSEISSPGMCPLVELRFRNENIDIKKPFPVSRNS